MVIVFEVSSLSQEVLKGSFFGVLFAAKTGKPQLQIKTRKSPNRMRGHLNLGAEYFGEKRQVFFMGQRISHYMQCVN
tara:strand:- start:9603 stop:9833 length:231 start_codon:yes stop_codon:yes gene_type:complete